MSFIDKVEQIIGTDPPAARFFNKPLKLYIMSPAEIIVTFLSICGIAFFIISAIAIDRAPTYTETCSGPRNFTKESQIRNRTYQLIYPGFKRFIAISDNLEDLYQEFIIKRYLNTNTEPLEIELPDGRIIPYYNYVFHKYFDHGGHGTEEDLISFLLTDVELEEFAAVS